MSRSVQLVSCSKTRRPRSDNCHSFSRPSFRRPGLCNTQLVCFFGNFFFNQFYGNWVFVNTQYATGFTGRGAYPPRKFGEIVCPSQDMECFLPLVVIDRIVELGNHITQGASLMTKRHAAIHTPCRLSVKGFLINGFINFLVVQNTLLRRT